LWNSQHCRRISSKTVWNLARSSCRTVNILPEVTVTFWIHSVTVTLWTNLVTVNLWTLTTTNYGNSSSDSAFRNLAYKSVFRVGVFLGGFCVCVFFPPPPPGPLHLHVQFCLHSHCYTACVQERGSLLEPRRFQLYSALQKACLRNWLMQLLLLLLLLTAIGLSPGGSSPTLVQTKIKIHKTKTTK
jgi:hypothetical protein